MYFRAQKWWTWNGCHWACRWNTATFFIFTYFSRPTILSLLTLAREDNFGPGSSVSTPLNITPHSLAVWSLIEALPNAWCCCPCRPHWAVQLEIWGLPCPQSGFVPNRFFFRRISPINVWNWIQSSMIILKYTILMLREWSAEAILCYSVEFFILRGKSK